MAKYVPNLMKTINLQIKRIMNFKQIEYKSNHTKVHHYKVTEYQCVCVWGGHFKSSQRKKTKPTLSAGGWEWGGVCKIEAGLEPSFPPGVCLGQAAAFKW